MTWKEGLIGIPLALLGAAVAVSAAAAIVLTGTDWGRERLREVALREINARIPGSLEVDAVTGGDPFRELRLAGVRVYEPDGRELARADSVHVSYRWWDFIAGDVTLSGARIVRPTVRLERAPGDQWNFDRVFSEPGPGPGAGGPARRVVLEQVTIRDGHVMLRMPAPEEDPTSEASPDEGLRWRMEEDAAGCRLAISLENLDASIPVARVVAPDEVGLLLQISSLSGRLALFEPPIDIEELRAELRLRRDTLGFDLWDLVLPGSRVFGEGWVSIGAEEGYSIALRGDPVAAADLIWLEPRLPREGEARLHFALRRDAGGTLLEATDAVWRSREARISGRFGMRVGDAPDDLAFRGVSLSIAALETTLLERFTRWSSPARGRVSGELALDGPISDLRIDADLRLRPETGAATTHLIARGNVMAQGGDRLGARDLEIVLDTLPFAMIRSFAPGVEIRGMLRGTGRVNGPLAEGLDITFQLEQREPGFSPSRFQGGGVIVRPADGPLRLDLEARAEPLSLTTLAEYYPGIPFRGNFRGRIRVVGTLDDLALQIGLGGAGDSLRLEAEVHLADPPTYRGTLTGRRIKLAAFREGLPQSDLDFGADFEGSGLTLPELRLGLRLEVLSSFVAGVRFDPSHADLRINGHRLEIDTVVLRGEFGRFSGAGALGFGSDSEDGGEFAFELEADSLGGFNPWLFPTREPFLVTGPMTDGNGSTDDEDVAGLEGSARARGRITGPLSRPGVFAEVAAARVRYEDWTADSLALTDLHATGFTDSLRFGGALRLASATIEGIELAGGRMTAEYADDVAAVEFDLEGAGDAAAMGGFSVRLEDPSTRLAVDSLAVRFGGSRWQLEGPARIDLAEDGALDIESLVLASERGRVEARGSIGTSGPASFYLDITGVNLSHLAQAFPQGAEFGGMLSAHAELSGRTRDPIIEGTVEVADGRLLGANFSSFAGSARYAAGDIELDLTMIRESQPLFRLHGTFPLELTLPGFAVTLPERAIRLTFEGDSIPISLFGVVSDEIGDLRGHARANVLVRGSPSDVSLVGEVAIFEGAVRVLTSGIRYEGVRGDLVFRGDRVELSGLTFQGPQEGRGQLTGIIIISDVDRPVFEVGLRADRLPIYDRPEARFSVSGNANLSGPYDRPMVTGDLTVTRGVLFVDEFGRRSQIIDPTVEEFFLLDTLFADANGPGVRTGRNPFLENLALEVNLAVERNTWLRSDAMNVEIAGNLQLRMQPEQGDVRIDGTLNAIRGDYQFLNRRFEVVEGTVEFVGTPGVNPNLDILAETRVPTRERPVVIQAVLTGTLEDPRLSLRSQTQPPINESDLLSYLVLGRPTYEITRGGVGEGNLLEDVVGGVPQAFFGYALESLLVSQTPIDYVEVTRTETAASAGIYGSGLAPAEAATQVEVGWYLAPRLFVSVAQQLRGVMERGTSVRVEWRVSDNLTLHGVTEPRLQRAVLGETTPSLGRSIGLFIFYGWSY